MTRPQATAGETCADQTAAVPANTNTLSVVNAADVDRALTIIDEKLAGLENAPLVKVAGLIAELRTKVTDIRGQMAGAAVEAVRREADRKVEITGAPAIIVRRSIGELISRGELRPGQKLPGQDIILAKVWEPTNRCGESLGKIIASFGAPENLPGDSACFNRNIVTIGNLIGWHGHDGWKFDPKRYGTQSYEDVRFASYRDGSGFDLWAVGELPVVNGRDRNQNIVGNPSENMLALNEKSDLTNFVTISGSDNAKWLQSCTESCGNKSCVYTVRFPDGSVDRDYKDESSNNCSCVRPVVALELSHLVI
ncbi:MAG: hypothetical protein P4M13_01245 [Alphaproteobacteria bacterium]|nr:hypothetical protein [Alphaproteobacteria bacterium]